MSAFDNLTFGVQFYVFYLPVVYFILAILETVNKEDPAWDSNKFNTNFKNIMLGTYLAVVFMQYVVWFWCFYSMTMKAVSDHVRNIFKLD